MQSRIVNERTASQAIRMLHCQVDVTSAMHLLQTTLHASLQEVNVRDKRFGGDG